MTEPLAVKVKSGLSLPPLQEVKWEALLPESVRNALQEIVRASARTTQHDDWGEVDDSLTCEECHEADALVQYVRAFDRPTQPLDKTDRVVENTQGIDVEAVFEVLQRGLATECTAFAPSISYRDCESFKQKLLRFLEDPHLKLIHVVRIFVMLGEIACDRDSEAAHLGFRSNFDIQFYEYLHHYRQTHEKNFGLRELAQVFTVLNLDADRIGKAIFGRFWEWRSFRLFNQKDETIWPYFAERLYFLEDVLSSKTTDAWIGKYEKAGCRDMAFAILQTFPQPPEALVSQLWEIALGSSKTEQQIAQQLLDKLPGNWEKVVVTLANRGRDARIAAAQWLARLGDRAAIPVLKHSLQREKSEAVKDAFVRSLEKLGAASEFLDRAGLRQEALELKKGIPAALAWFPFQVLPPVYWEDTGEAVDCEILTWFIIQSYKQKTPEPSPIWRQYASYWSQGDREQLGQFVLASWIERDTHSHEEVKSSAIKDKGILAVAGAVFQEDIIQTFRPLEDGTLTDAENNLAIVLESDIRIAHASFLSAELVRAWQTHLEDYEVIPLFQLSKEAYSLPLEERQSTKLTDFEGYLLEAFQLRGKANQLGYIRGQTQDGGWFYDYKKTFPGLGLEVAIEFTGNFLPEENRRVALTQLCFRQLHEADTHGYGPEQLPLGQVPPVLLSEAWNDLREIAGRGTGYDPDWEKLSQY